MRFSIRFADKIVGVLVLVGLAVLIATIFMIGKSQRWFKSDYQYVSYFDSAVGLSTNMPIQYKGFTIGHVKSIELADDDRVRVIFTIFDEYRDRWVKEGSLVELSGSPIPGFGNSFLFYPGRGENILDEFSIIPDIHSVEGKMIIASGMTMKPESEDMIGDLLALVDSVLYSADELLSSLNETAEILNHSLSGDKESNNYPIGQILWEVEGLVSSIADPNGMLMLALDGDGPVYRDLTSMLNSISGMLEDLNRTTHVLPSQLPVLLTDLSITLRDVQDLLIAVSNNPLLRGGLPQRVETGPGGAATRDLEF